ncbi:MAG: hypothetical protein ABI690_03130 [Chloroflexota bacterium]
MSTWLVRLLFAAMLMFGSEILVWVNPPGRVLLDWLFLIPGYILLAALVLDLAIRYRVRDLFGALVLTGIFSLLAALVLNPQYAFLDMPRTFITRVMGAHALLATEMLGLFLVLTGGSNKRARRLFFLGCLIVGLAWGIWVRLWPIDEGYGLVDMTTMLLYGAVGIIIIGVLLAVIPARTTQLTPENLQLSRAGWGTTFLLLVGLFVLRLFLGGMDVGGVILAGILLVICWAILWFRERPKGDTFLDGHIPIQRLPSRFLAVALVIFFAAGIAAYNLPLILIQQANQLTLIGIGFTAYGLAWLPTVSLVLGMRAYSRQISKGRSV